MRHTQLPDQQTEWTEADARLVFDEWHRSGTSIAAFAREHGVSAARLYWWKRRLSKPAARSSMMSLVPATVIPVAGPALVIRLTTPKGRTRRTVPMTETLLAAHQSGEMASILEELLLARFVPVQASEFRLFLARKQAAEEAGYPKLA